MVTPKKAKDCTKNSLLSERKKAAKNAGEKFSQRKPRPIQDPAKSNRTPSTLYNGMIAPLVPYAVKGAIWHWGESNRNYQNDKYQKYFTALIEGYTAWAQDRLDFYFCQLAQFQDPVKEPIDEDGWVNVTYQQLLTVLNVPHTGMAVLNDIGEANDIHLHNKIDAGKRLSSGHSLKLTKQVLMSTAGHFTNPAKLKAPK